MGVRRGRIAEMRVRFPPAPFFILLVLKWSGMYAIRWMVNRLLVLIIGFAPFIVITLLANTTWRLYDGHWSWLGYALFALGTGIALWNFYISFFVRRKHPVSEEDNPFGNPPIMPFFGVIPILGIAMIPHSAVLVAASCAVAIVDTAGTPWFLIAFVREGWFWHADKFFDRN
jgi:hypothetical protein